MYLLLSLGNKKQLYPVYPGILSTIKEGDLVDVACHNSSDLNGSFVRDFTQTRVLENMEKKK